MEKITAKIIGEESAGMTVVQIYSDGDLVWSHRYFRRGATDREYRDGLMQVYTDTVSARDYADYDGCDYDDDGDIIDYDTDDYTVILEYDASSETWTHYARAGQSDEIADALMLTGRIPVDTDHYQHCHNDIVREIASYLSRVNQALKKGEKNEKNNQWKNVQHRYGNITRRVR